MQLSKNRKQIFCYYIYRV